MSLKKFKPVEGKLLHTTADWSIRKGKKEEFTESGYAIGFGRPWEFQHVKDLGTVPGKPKYVKEKVFDVKEDGKPFVKKKEPPNWKKKKPYMINEKGAKEYDYH